jgi:hypothetical protein
VNGQNCFLFNALPERRPRIPVCGLFPRVDRLLSTYFFNWGDKKYLLDAKKPSIYFRALTEVD